MNAPPNIERRMEQMPIDIDWLAALRHLENRSAAKPVGEFYPLSQEALLLRAGIGLVFPATAIIGSGIEISAFNAGRPSITSPLLGLSGPLAALPYHYTEALLAARRGRNRAALDFFDIFNHRAQSLFYRALRKHRWVLDKERALAQGSGDRYSRLLSALCGHSEPQRPLNGGYVGGNANHALPSAAWTSFAGLFATRIRSANNLQQLLRHYFQLDITIEQFTGRWITIDNESRCRLGAHHNVHQPPVRQPLGGGTLLGRRSWQAAAFFGITVHHPDATQLAQLAVGQSLRTALWSVVRAFVGDEYDFHVDVVTNNAVQCAARLNCSQNSLQKPASATRLGWLGVLGTMSPSETATIRINHSTAARMQR